ncbi:phosphate uptake regulator [Caldisphaera lagunensis DSM 15908]|uniref:Phosphate uptake regulator n=1 Tax=Caldisphaera lagunensis (strain DSM 15908 / JCM 11604 / ANMR 0165 / IC-154) TaxID=1056495 RepID=L0A803_CALLD|nr:AbrB/MazE/SpoVT family DNA-binding domain-containing protein [Caldisphaera lagunensis]AFZ69998.1 phosphate uptake regulator [Caldisphaera lagunensis DSM 15908]
MGIVARKVQRLGASSYVITLPHTWIEANNIKPGDTVYIVDDDNKLSIIPSQKDEEKSKTVYEMDLGKIPIPEIASLAIYCLYVHNLGDTIINMGPMGKKGVESAKQAALSLLGLDVFELGESRIMIRPVIDDSKIEIKQVIKGLGMIVSDITGILRDALNGLDVTQSLQLSQKDLLKYQHLVERHVVDTMLHGKSDVRLHALVLGSGLLGVVGYIMWDAADKANKIKIKSEEISSLITNIKDILPQLGSIIAQPSIKRTQELLLQIMAITMDVEEKSINSKDSRETMILTKVADALKLLNVILYVITCSAVTSEEYLRKSNSTVI